MVCSKRPLFIFFCKDILMMMPAFLSCVLSLIISCKPQNVNHHLTLQSMVLVFKAVPAWAAFQLFSPTFFFPMTPSTIIPLFFYSLTFNSTFPQSFHILLIQFCLFNFLCCLFLSTSFQLSFFHFKIKCCFPVTSSAAPLLIFYFVFFSSSVPFPSFVGFSCKLCSSFFLPIQSFFNLF